MSLCRPVSVPAEQASIASSRTDGRAPSVVTDVTQRRNTGGYHLSPVVRTRRDQDGQRFLQKRTIR
jgi:hypothetical protein